MSGPSPGVERRPGSARAALPRATARACPAGIEAADLDEGPGERPRPRDDPVPPELRDEIEAAMARYPDRHSASIPALAGRAAAHGWCSPEAIAQVACVMRADARPT